MNCGVKKLYTTGFHAAEVIAVTWQAANISENHWEGRSAVSSKSRHKLVRFIGSHAKTRPPTMKIIILGRVSGVTWGGPHLLERLLLLAMSRL